MRFSHAELNELLNKNGIAYRKEIRWQPALGVYCSVSSAFHASAEAADRDAVTAALEAGYYAPKWWQFWRWREPKVGASFLLTCHPPVESNSGGGE